MIPARLWQVSVGTTGQGEEAVVDLLEQSLRQSPSIYRNEKTGEVTVSVFAEMLPGPLAVVRLGLREGLQRLTGLGLDLGAARLVIKPLRRENWAESWKRHFKPFAIGSRLLIKPSWSKRRPRPGQEVVILDPGLSFGTGHHPTTLFCLRQVAGLRRRHGAQSLLDLGSGSGILAIAAAKLGYKPVVALDYDPEAVRAARQNIKRNQARVFLRQADLTRMPKISARRYDVVCANLISDLLIAEAEKISHMLKPGGKLVVAGVLRREFSGLAKKLLKSNLTLETTWAKKEWKSGTFALSR